MKIDAMNMLKQSARTLRHSGDGGRAYLMLVFANHLRQVVRGEVTIEEFNRVYVGFDRDPIDIDVECPEPKE
jgi:hypothetical protein